MTHHKFKLHHGDCREILRDFDDESVDSVVTDPPYELGFMGKAWDAAGVAYDVDLWAEVLRVLKPGGHLLAFGGTRTYHRMACAIEDAGFEIRDSINWLYGSGFPKSLDVSKAIDRAAGAEREVVGLTRPSAQSVATNAFGAWGDGITPTAPATPEAAEWEGWGTALKPAHEPIVVARKPLAGTVAANVLAHGTGALNIDGCRVAYDPLVLEERQQWFAAYGQTDYAHGTIFAGIGNRIAQPNTLGRWPANVVLDRDAATELDRQSGISRDGVAVNRNRPSDGSIYAATSYHVTNRTGPDHGYGGEGGASRFFYRADHTDDDLTSFRYVPKPDRAERDAGLDDLAEREVHRYGAGIGGGLDPNAPASNRNNHPTVKPLDLMRWLIRLVTPPDGTVLDPFAGSGTTIAAALLEGFEVIGIELTDEYLPIIERRARWAQQEARFGAVTGPTVIRKTMPGEVSLFDDVEGTA